MAAAGRARHASPRGATRPAPADLHSAYDLPTAAPRPQTIALVDAYNDPTAEADLKPTTKNSACPLHGRQRLLQAGQQNGESGALPFPKTTARTRSGLQTAPSEERERRSAKKSPKLGARDLARHRDRPRRSARAATSLLVEADSTRLRRPRSGRAQRRALGANEISNSWGGPEAERSARATARAVQPPRHRDHRLRRRRRLPELGRGKPRRTQAYSAPNSPRPRRTWSRSAARA